MNVDFSKSQTGEGAVPVTQQDATHAVTTTVPMPVAVPRSKPTLSEVILPRINLVHSVGTLKDSFPVGAFVHNQELVLYTPPRINAKTQTVEQAGSPPLIVTFLDVRPVRYFENVKGGGRGMICDTEEQVRNVSGTTNFKEFQLKEKDGMKRFDLGSDCLLAIERPEMAADDGTVFVFAVGDKKYALALYNFKASAFTVIKQTINQWRLIGCLRDGLSTRSVALSSKLKPTPDRSSTYWCPAIVPHKETTPEFREWADSVLQAPQRETDDAGE